MALHIAFVSKDVDADEAKLIAAGATKYGETIREYGNTIAMLRDPWGLAIQLAWSISGQSSLCSTSVIPGTSIGQKPSHCLSLARAAGA